METRYKAQDIYNQIRKEEEEPQSTKDILKRTFKLIVQFLSTCRPSERFQFCEFMKIIETSASTGDFSSGKASTAFENLELYLILILKNPWKTEYREIRRYGGFYQSKIASHLNHAEEVFKLVGFKEMYGDKLVFTRQINRESLLAVSFECLVASVECWIIGNILQRCGPVVTVEEILSRRRNYTGDVEKLSGDTLDQRHLKTKKLDEMTVCKPVSDTEVDLIENSLNASKNNFIGSEKSGKFRNTNIPYIDEDMGGKSTVQTEYQEGTHDEHLMASMQLVSKEKKPSDEWSYVRDGLREKYGDGYFDGMRGDMLKQDDGDEGIEEGLMSDRSNANQHVTRRKSNLKNSTSHKDSGYVDGLPHQPVFYPPTQDLRTGLQSRSSSNFIAQPSQLSSAVVHAQLSAAPVVAEETIQDPFYQKVAQVGSQSPVSQDLIQLGNEGMDFSRSYPQHRQHVVQKQGHAPNPLSMSYNFSHSAPMARKMANVDRNSTATDVVLTRSTSKSMANSQSEWTCPHCTVANRSSDNICGVCFKSRKDKNSKSLDVRWGQKQCSQCTFLNESNAVACEMCNAPLSGSQTVL